MQLTCRKSLKWRAHTASCNRKTVKCPPTTCSAHAIGCWQCRVQRRSGSRAMSALMSARSSSADRLACAAPSKSNSSKRPASLRFWKLLRLKNPKCHHREFTRMSISFYDASVASYLQSLRAVAGFLETGRKFFAEQSIDPDEIVDARIHPDMLPFRFQFQS